SEERLERLRERVGHHDLVLRREDYALQLRNAALLRLYVDRLDVHEAVSHREHEQVAADAAGATATAEQRELLADRGVGIDARLDLRRTEDGAVAREREDAELAVVGRVGATSDPGDHVVALAARRRHRHEEHERGSIRSGAPPRPVVGPEAGSGASMT